MMSTVGIVSGSLDTIFSLWGGKKWITRLGRKGISRTGSGAPAASGLKKSLAERTDRAYVRTRVAGKVTPAVYTFSHTGYTEAVTKRLVDIDDELLERAKSELGCTTIKDTVNRALGLVADARVERVDNALRVLALMPLLERDDAWR